MNNTNEFGLEIGQLIRRRLKASKKAGRKYVAYADVPLPDNTFDNRIILIINDSELDESSAGKYCTLKIIERYERCYIAEADELEVSEYSELIYIYAELNPSGELTFEIGVVGEEYRIPTDLELLWPEGDVHHEVFNKFYAYVLDFIKEHNNCGLMLYFS